MWRSNFAHKSTVSIATVLILIPCFKQEPLGFAGGSCFTAFNALYPRIVLY